MYNSTNLPLEPRKVIKKSIGSIFVWLIIVLMVIVFFSWMPGQVTTPGSGSEIDQMASVIKTWTWIIYIVVTLLSIFYQYLYYKFYYYNFQEDSAEIKKGVVSQATGHVYYARIQNIYVDQDILDRIMGLYDVHYETAGESSSFYSHVDGLNKTNADKLVQFILGKAKNTPGTIQNQPVTETTNVAQNTPPSPPVNLSTIYDKNNLPLSPSYTFLMILQSSISLILFALYLIYIFFSSAGGASQLIFFLLTIFVLLTIAIIRTILWVKYLNYNFDQIKGTLVTGIIARQTKIVYYNRIQNINVGQSFMERIFGLYNVSIETAGEGQTMKTSNSSIFGNIGNAFAIPGLKKEEADTLKKFLLENSQISRANI